MAGFVAVAAGAIIAERCHQYQHDIFSSHISIDRGIYSQLTAAAVFSGAATHRCLVSI